jgi:hypothetical protein
MGLRFNEKYATKLERIRESANRLAKEKADSQKKMPTSNPFSVSFYLFIMIFIADISCSEHVWHFRSAKKQHVSWATETYENSLPMDHVFERFTKRVGYEAKQCVRFATNLSFSLTN